MAWVGYSTVAQLRDNVGKADEVDDVGNEVVQGRITEGDKLIKSKLSHVIDFSLVPADSTDATFPNFLNKLSQFKAAELVLVKMFGAKRRVNDITDITYWKDEYKELLDEIMAGDVALELEDGTSIAGVTDTLQVGKENIRPAMGLGEYGGFVSDDTLEEDRPQGQEYDERYFDTDDVTTGDS